MISKILIAIIRLYQKTLSLDHGWFRSAYPAGYCKYSPTCSEYFIQSLEKKGLLIGFALGCWRILRCNPWSKGGNDPVR
jgi:putative membrane protein insertion efficiency factor